MTGSGMLITLPWPPSANHYWRHPSSGKLAGRHLISAEGRAYRRTVWALCREQQAKMWILPCKIDLLATAPDRRTRDLDNLMKAILDALKYAKVVADDSLIWDIHIAWETHGIYKAVKAVKAPGCVGLTIRHMFETLPAIGGPASPHWGQLISTPIEDAF